LDRCEDRDRIETARTAPELSGARTQLLDAVSAAVRALDTREWGAAIKTAATAEESIQGMVTPFRDATMADMARGEVEGPRGSQMMQALRWMRRTSKHIASIAEYLERAYQAAGKENK
jgi:phosphate:Na+ symporter